LEHGRRHGEAQLSIVGKGNKGREVPIPANIGFESGNDGQHAIDGTTRSYRGVDASLDGFEVCPGETRGSATTGCTFPRARAPCELQLQLKTLS